MIVQYLRTMQIISSDHLSELRLIQFLGGLNDFYDQVRRQILLKGITPTLNQAYAMIAGDEIQQLAYAFIINHKPDPIEVQVNRSSNMNYRRQNYKEKRYDYCHFNGNIRENCYKLIGYPIDRKKREEDKI